MSVTPFNVTVMVQDDQGNSDTQSVGGTVTTPDVVKITSLVMTPLDGPPGTTRTVTAVATSADGRPLTASISGGATGTVFTPVPGQPADTFSWTFPQ